MPGQGVAAVSPRGPRMAHRRRAHRAEHALSPSGVPLPAFLLPVAVLLATGYAAGGTAGNRTWPVLAIGLAVLLVLTLIGPLLGLHAPTRYAAARRVLLRALFATMLLFALCCAWIAAFGLDGALGSWPGIVFLPGWLVFAVLIPLWADSPVIRSDQPATGWKSVRGFRLVYADPDDEALWVYMEPQISRGYRSVLYAPNLGHHWGRAAMATLVVLILAMVALLVAG